MTQLKDLNLLDIGNTIQLTGAIYSGNGKHYLCYFPDEHPAGEKIEELLMSKEDWEKFLRQTDLLETEILQHNPENGTMVRAIVRKTMRQIDQNVSWKVYRRDNYSCRYCGKNDVPLTVDHLVLWEEGGPSIEANLVSACKKCNRTRGNMQYIDWLKSQYYFRVSKGLGNDVAIHNLDLITTLSKIPRTVHKRSR
jgi:hypothetical protein